MATLLLAEIANGHLGDITARALTAALQLGAPVEVLVAGRNVAEAAAAAAKLAGVAKVRVADDALYEHGLAEPLAALLVALAPEYDAILAASSPYSKNVLPRAAAVLTTGDLITKTEAISRLPDFGVPSTLAGEIRRRRDGQVAMLNADQKVRRALLARERRPAWPRIPGLPRSRTLRWISAPTPPRDLAEQCRDGGEDDG